jgi:peptide/nickel transport system substrate-binding protein
MSSDELDKVLRDLPAYSRGDFLKRALAAELALVAAAGGIGATAVDAAVKDLSGPAQRRGGRLRIGVIGNGTSETYNPAVSTVPIDIIRENSVFDPLVRLGQNFDFRDGLAVDWVPNRDGTVWEIHLRPGVEWHDGKSFTADDVIWNFRRMGNPAHFGHFSVAKMRLGELRKRGNLIVRVPLRSPEARLQDYFTLGTWNAAFMVRPGTTNFTKPIGTGPYIAESFTPGQQSLARRNTNYWQNGRPFPDELQVLSFDDPVAALNALQSGQLDASYPVPAPLAAAKKANPSSSSWQLVETKGGFAQVIYMRMDLAPFKDPRVRLAMKLIPDRRKMIDTVLSGFGTLANDLLGTGLQYYAKLPQHNQDIARARSLLRAAGRSDLRITLRTSPALPAQVEAAQFFAQQAALAGVRVNVQVVPPGQYYDPSLLYLKMPFAVDSWPSVALGPIYRSIATSDAPQGQDHNTDKVFDRYIDQATAELNPKRAQQRWTRAQRRFWANGGYIVWGNRTGLTAMGSNVRGYGSGWLFPLDNLTPTQWALTA